MQALDRHAIEELGIAQAALMELAGRAVADGVSSLVENPDDAVLCLAGTGNNGGDAIVAARHLRERGHPVTIVLVGDRERLSEGCRHQAEVASRCGLEVLNEEGSDAADRIADLLPAHAVVVDGLFGTGLDRPIEGWRRTVVERVEVEARRVVAVDIPSGVDADTGAVLGAAVRADLTVCFQYPKVGHASFPGRDLAGELRVVDIGIPSLHLEKVGPVAVWTRDEALRDALPPRGPDSHKGSFGRLLVLAGQPDAPGSALLAARAGMRAGAGLVTIGSDDATIARIAPALLELMGRSLGAGRIDPTRLGEALPGTSALVVGPSLAPDKATLGLLEALLPLRAPIVLDAGALGALALRSDLTRGRQGPTIITPHPGEAARLLGLDTAVPVQADRLAAARRLAERTGAITVLKGAATVVAEPGGAVALSSRGSPGLATAGTGDVLAGIIGGLLAQGVEPGLAARAGVELHGWAGERASAALGERAVLASDVVRYLGGPIHGIDELG